MQIEEKKLNRTKNDTIRVINNVEVQDIIATAEEAKREVTPLIKVNVLVNENPAVALYDSRSNISLINHDF